MNKTELIRSTKEILDEKYSDITLKDTTMFVDAAIEAIKNAVIKGEKVSIVGFGTFEAVERAERKIRDLHTGKELMVAASKSPKFKPSGSFKEAVKNA